MRPLRISCRHCRRAASFLLPGTPRKILRNIKVTEAPVVKPEISPNVIEVVSLTTRLGLEGLTFGPLTMKACYMHIATIPTSEIINPLVKGPSSWGSWSYTNLCPDISRSKISTLYLESFAGLKGSLFPEDVGDFDLPPRLAHPGARKLGKPKLENKKIQETSSNIHRKLAQYLQHTRILPAFLYFSGFRDWDISLLAWRCSTKTGGRVGSKLGPNLRTLEAGSEDSRCLEIDLCSHIQTVDTSRVHMKQNPKENEVWPSTNTST